MLISRAIFAALLLVSFEATAVTIPYEGDGANVIYSDNTGEKAFWRYINANGGLTDIGGRVVSTPPFMPMPKEQSLELSRQLCLNEWKWERFFPDDRGGGKCLIRESVAKQRFRERAEDLTRSR